MTDSPNPSTGAANIRQAFRRARRLDRHGTLTNRAGGEKQTPSLEELYGKFIRAGMVQIVRKKGRPPRVKWLRYG
jgi:hypothetical protein